MVGSTPSQEAVKPPTLAGVWKHFTLGDGLPDLKIECLYVDGQDRLWIGTHDQGLVGFAEGRFTQYTRRDGLAGNSVFALLEDRQGHLWIGTREGLSWYDGDAFHIVRTSTPYGFLWGCCRDERGGLWFGLERRVQSPPALGHWDGRSFRVWPLTEDASLEGQSLHSLVLDPEGTLWCGGHGFYHYDPRRHQGRRIDAFAEEFHNPEIGALLARPEGGLWLATEAGLYLFDGRAFSRPAQEEATWGYVAAVADGQRPGALWLTTCDGALVHYDGCHFRAVRRPHTRFWRGLCPDRRERLWISTYGMGLYGYSERRIQHYREAHHLPLAPTRCLARSAAGGLWIGAGQGVVYRDPGRPTFRSLKAFTGKGITALLEDSRRRLWVGVEGEGLYLWEAEQAQPVHALPPAAPCTAALSALAEDRAGRIWFAYGFGGGFGYWAEGQLHYWGPQAEAPYPTWIEALAVEEDGPIWLGSSAPAPGQGLYRFAPDTLPAVPVWAGGPIRALCRTGEGLWIGAGEGLRYLDLSAGDAPAGRPKTTLFTRQDGLTCEIITCLTQAGDGTLLIGTEGGGLFGYDGSIFQNMEWAETPDYNVIHAILPDEAGGFWLATEGGLVHYRPQSTPPRVAIRAVRADQEYASPRSLSFPTTIPHIRFGWAGASPASRVSHLLYRYRLEGVDEDWRRTTDVQVEYPQLLPGDYTFFIQAVDGDFNYSTIARVRLTVEEDPLMGLFAEAPENGKIPVAFLGESPAFRQVKQQIRTVAPTDLTVLILGETGAGKSLAAQVIHALSPRRNHPFVHVNCGTLQPELVNSELFGHEPGAFTGALQRRVGKFEQAAGGTLFLDEIGDLQPNTQAHLLHVLQERQIERLGGSQRLPVDVRVLAATHSNLEQAVARGRFRADLFYRLKGSTITLPSLRERKEDLPGLADFFARRFAARLERVPLRISPACLEVIKARDWPGNVRELEHVLEQAVLVARDGVIHPEDLSWEVWPVPTGDGDHARGMAPLDKHQRDYLIRVLEHTGGVLYGAQGAAALLGIPPSTLRHRLEKLGIPFKKRVPRR